MTNTPWGVAQDRERIAEGITFYSTPSHGGFHLSRERNAKVPERYRAYAAMWSHGWGDTWYEEDCAALAVILTYPDYFPHVSLDDLDKFRRLLEEYSG